MKNLVLVLMLLFSVILGSCGALAPDDVKITNAYNSGQIYIGASMEQVAQAMGGYPPSWCQKARITQDGTVVLWDYATSSNLCGANLAASYAFVFVNGRLTEIRQVNSELDLQL